MPNTSDTSNISSLFYHYKYIVQYSIYSSFGLQSRRLFAIYPHLYTLVKGTSTLSFTHLSKVLIMLLCLPISQKPVSNLPEKSRSSAYLRTWTILFLKITVFRMPESLIAFLREIFNSRQASLSPSLAPAIVKNPLLRGSHLFLWSVYCPPRLSLLSEPILRRYSLPQ